VGGKGEREGEKAGQYLQEETRLIARSLHRDGQRHAKSHPGHERVLYGYDNRREERTKRSKHSYPLSSGLVTTRNDNMHVLEGIYHHIIIIIIIIIGGKHEKR